MKAKKSLLFNGDEAFVKRAKKKFDVTQGSYDGAETCDLVENYLLNFNVGVNMTSVCIQFYKHYKQQLQY